MTMFLIVVGVLFILFFIVRPYLIKYDTIIAFTGGLGSGKTYLSVKYALRLLTKQRLKVWFFNNIGRYIRRIFHLKRPMEIKRPKPMLYSSID